ncbi:unnamed protein product [Gadus morhua 'NCC']
MVQLVAPGLEVFLRLQRRGLMSVCEAGGGGLCPDCSALWLLCPPETDPRTRVPTHWRRGAGPPAPRACLL